MITDKQISEVLMYKINLTRMLWGAKNSLSLGNYPRSFFRELLNFWIVTTIASLPQALLLSIVQSALMIGDPEYIALMSKPEVGMDEIAQFTLDFAQRLPSWFSAVSLISSGFMIIAALVYCKKFEKRKAYTLGFVKRGLLAEYSMGLLIGAVMLTLPVSACLITKCVWLAPSNGIDYAVIALYFVAFLIQGLGEEALFRGYLLTSLARSRGIWFSIIASSLLFSLFHAGNTAFSLIAFINIFLFGVFASVFMLKRGSIWATAAIHSVWNFMQGNIFGFNVSGNASGVTVFSAHQSNFGAILSGGEFGIEGGLGATVVLLIAILCALLMPTKKSEYVPDEDDNTKASQAQ